MIKQFKVFPKEITENTIFLVGNFDGVHLGHQFLIKSSVDFAKNNQCKLCLCTFDPHPYVFINQLENNHHFLLTTKSEKYDFIYNLGVDHIMEIVFDESLKNCNGIDFLNNISTFFKENVRGFVMGYDSSFGKNKEFSAKEIKSYCDERGYLFDQEDPKKVDEIAVSSSHIRNLLKEGQVFKVKQLLGRHYCISGQVISNKGLGSKEKTPTANIVFPTQKHVPLKGVYLTELEFDNQRYPSISNVGINPTIDNHQKVHVETHILDHNEYHLSDKEIKVHFIKFVRKEKKFEDKNELFSQIRKDISDAKSYFKI